ncbi:LysM peptidoglycan-binding domain-containing protein [Deinococcus aluminii]|uniref:LysM peptidoglycan-binding domain-containing protein n=1 Tax=Deinococcus aluminii TaxID=1656885 RepID=A0ABP9XGB8_9DEIO
MNARALLLVTSLTLGAAQAQHTHLVQPGDTLSRIARTYQTTPGILRSLNALPTDALHPGQMLRLPTAQYTVVAGDTLYSIARRAGVTPEALATLNGLTSSTVQVGQVLQLPEEARPSVQATLAQATAPTPAPSRGLERGLFNPAQLPAATPVIRAASLGGRPASAYLPNVGFTYQTLNNCGPAAIAAALQQYGVRVTQATWQRDLRPDGKNMHLPAAQHLLERLGFQAPVLRGGTVEDIKRLVAQGIPVIVLQFHQEVGKIPHFRVVRGYDDAAGHLIMSDSLSGPNVALTERDFDVLWNTQGRQYMPVRPG